MNAHKPERVLKRPLLVSATATLVLFGVFAVLISSRIQQNLASERLGEYNSVISFQSEIEELLFTNVQRLEGFRAWLELNEGPDSPGTREFLDKLLQGQEGNIRSVSVIEDTTIVWTYPRRGNEGAIGNNLALVPQQRISVLYVKETGKAAITEPVNLLQGGRGLIVRSPIQVNGEYWGQLGIVLDAGQVFRQIDTRGEEMGIEYALFLKEKFPEESFYGDAGILDRDPLVAEIGILNASWSLALMPEDGWSNQAPSSILSGVAALLLSLGFGFLMYLLLSTRSRLREQAIFDALTGLHSRGYFVSYSSTLIARAEREKSAFALVLLDVNNLKPVNDNYGHKAGDMVLRSIGYLLKKNCRSSEAAFRTGGDEFMLLLSDISTEDELNLAMKRFRKELKFPLKFNGVQVTVSVSMGAALFPRDGSSIGELTDAADTRMYRDKREQKQESGITGSE
ncbi:diguanylate cyclase domain-containing protein [Salinispira pacifica]|uniref:Sensory box/GGDEF family protein n=1 Tax=Salinispira pacifica TaxID=1307761 RepID=V5WM80_9SPIO|nr:diguanylate cyclase [Salinispira pacifica]AHC16725.1 Sensory box/GGDEF family protein [Salinispira pacifica]